MKAFKRIISSMLALVMFVSIFPLGVFAEGENDNIYSITNGILHIRLMPIRADLQ